jgi:hypothetical protein
MRTLYEASSIVEAHLLKDLLVQEGVPVVIHGEFLQGGIGELPATGLIRLTVDDPHFPAGRALIERWEAGAIVDRIDLIPFDRAGLDPTSLDQTQPDRGDPSRAPAGDDEDRDDVPDEGRNRLGMWGVVAMVAAACWLYAHALEASGPSSGADARVVSAGAARPAALASPGIGTASGAH